jgi:hypothetical protein
MSPFIQVLHSNKEIIGLIDLYQEQSFREGARLSKSGNQYSVSLAGKPDLNKARPGWHRPAL